MSLISYFVDQPLPSVAFQLSSAFLSGILVSPKERKIKDHFICPLEKGVIQPSFNQSNIQNLPLLERRMKESLARFRFSERKIACLIPESSIKAFVFSFESLPASRKEQEQLIRFRVKKQVPLLPEDSVLTFARGFSAGSVKVLAAVARRSMIDEVEKFFERFGLRVRAIGIPSLALNNLVDKEKAENFLLVNIEDDSLSLVATINSEMSLYRLKSFIPEPQTSLASAQRIETVVREVENTLRFIEDKERKKLQRLWLRLGLLQDGEDISSRLKERPGLPLMGIESCLEASLGLKERKILSPLAGQILR